MQKKLLYIFICLTSISSILHTEVQAQSPTICNITTNPARLITDLTSFTVTFDPSQINNIRNTKYKPESFGDYYIIFPELTGKFLCPDYEYIDFETKSSIELHHSDCESMYFNQGGHRLEVKMYDANSVYQPICTAIIEIASAEPTTCNIDAVPASDGSIDDEWKINVTNIRLAKNTSKVGIYLYNAETANDQLLQEYQGADLNKTSLEKQIENRYKAGETDLEARFYAYHPDIFCSDAGCTTYDKKDSSPACAMMFKMAGKGSSLPPPTPTPTLSPECLACRVLLPGDEYTMKCDGECNKCRGCPGYTPPEYANLKGVCEQLSDPYKEDCGKCMTQGKIWSAIGCLPTDVSGLVGDFIFKIGIGIAGGISFLYFLYGCFLIITSSGNPEKIEEAKQIIVSALSGLLLIIFSVFILQVIGVSILRLPGFE